MREIKSVVTRLQDSEKYIDAIDDAIMLIHKMETLMMFFIDSNPCKYDHNGLCQEHSLHKNPCPHETAKKMLGI